METLSRLPLPETICFAYPHQTRPVSVTGAQCELNCAHCGGHYLKHMQPLTALTAVGTDTCASWLVSGGCQPDGAVPIGEHIDKLAQLKQERRFNMHVGLIPEDIIARLAPITDCVSFDFVADQPTINEVFGTNRTVADYVACYQSLQRKVKVVPHICVGLRGGNIEGEYRAMDLLRELGTDALTLIIFIPTPATRYADRRPPSLADTAKLLSHARLAFPDIPLHLGCMRPGGRYREEIDKWAVRVGFNTIVNPAPGAVQLAEKLGLTLTRGEECCVL